MFLGRKSQQIVIISLIQYGELCSDLQLHNRFQYCQVTVFVSVIETLLQTWVVDHNHPDIAKLSNGATRCSNEISYQDKAVRILIAERIK